MSGSWPKSGRIVPSETIPHPSDTFGLLAETCLMELNSDYR